MKFAGVFLLVACLSVASGYRNLLQQTGSNTAVNYNPVAITVSSAPFDILATPITPVLPYSQAAYQCNVTGDTRYPPYATGTFPLTVSVPVGQRVRVIFANGNLNGATVTQQGVPGVIVQQGGAVIVQQVGGASPIVQGVGSPIVQVPASPAQLVNQGTPTVIQPNPPPVAPTVKPSPPPPTPGTPTPATPTPATPAPATPTPATPAPGTTTPAATTRPPTPGPTTPAPATTTPAPTTTTPAATTRPPTPAPTTTTPSPTTTTPSTTTPAATTRAPTPAPTTPAPSGQSCTVNGAAGFLNNGICIQVDPQNPGGSQACTINGAAGVVNNGICVQVGRKLQEVASGRNLLQATVPGGPNNGLVEYVGLVYANTVPGFVVPNTQFGVPYVEFTASASSAGQTAVFQGSLVVANVVGGVPQYPFTPNNALSPFCQVNVNFKNA